MLRDYAMSMTLVLVVLLGYTALLFWKKPESTTTAARTEVRAEASVLPTTNAASSESSADVVERN